MKPLLLLFFTSIEAEIYIQKKELNQNSVLNVIFFKSMLLLYIYVLLHLNFIIIKHYV